MKNSQVAEIFINSDKEAKTEHLFIEGRVIYSYGYHFPIALKLNNNIFIFNSDRYSNSTAKHKGYCKRAIGSFKIIEMNTARIKDLISQDIKDINEVIFDKL